MLRLGADADTVTVTHWAEYLANIPNKRRIQIAYARADIGHQIIEGLDDTDGTTEWNGGDYFSRILIDYLAAECASRGKVKTVRPNSFQDPPSRAHRFHLRCG